MTHDLLLAVTTQAVTTQAVTTQAVTTQAVTTQADHSSDTERSVAALAMCRGPKPSIAMHANSAIAAAQGLMLTVTMQAF